MSYQPDELTISIHQSRFRAHVNLHYFLQLCPLYATVERVISWLIAVGASASVAKWGIWNDMPGSYELFGGITACLSIFNAVFGLQNRVSLIADLQAKWLARQISWDGLWVRLRANEDVTGGEVEALRTTEIELQKLEASLWKFEFLRNRAQDAACVAMGLPKRGKSTK